MLEAGQRQGPVHGWATTGDWLCGETDGHQATEPSRHHYVILAEQLHVHHEVGHLPVCT